MQIYFNSKEIYMRYTFPMIEIKHNQLQLVDRVSNYVPLAINLDR